MLNKLSCSKDEVEELSFKHLAKCYSYQHKMNLFLARGLRLVEGDKEISKLFQKSDTWLILKSEQVLKGQQTPLTIQTWVWKPSQRWWCPPAGFYRIWLLLLFSLYVTSDCDPHGLQHARIPCPSPSPGVCPSSCPLSWWCHPIISPSAGSPFAFNLSQHQGLFQWGGNGKPPQYSCHKKPMKNIKKQEE